MKTRKATPVRPILQYSNVKLPGSIIPVKRKQLSNFLVGIAASLARYLTYNNGVFSNHLDEHVFVDKCLVIWRQ